MSPVLGSRPAEVLDFDDRGSVVILSLVQHLPLVCPSDLPEERCGIKVHIETDKKSMNKENATLKV